MPYSYPRTIHFADTDAAGVVYFARYLSICHEAYEEALNARGVAASTIFAKHALVIPIARSEASYLRPLHCGDRVRVEVCPRRLTAHSFELHFTLWKIGSVEKRAAVARTEHVCICSTSRERRELPLDIAAWVDTPEVDSPASA